MVVHTYNLRTWEVEERETGGERDCGTRKQGAMTDLTMLLVDRMGLWIGKAAEHFKLA